MFAKKLPIIIVLFLLSVSFVLGQDALIPAYSSSAAV